MERTYEKYFRQNRLPHLWCPGCGNGIAMKAIVQAIEKKGLSQDNTVIVSGIGCSSRASGYMMHQGTDRSLDAPLENDPHRGTEQDDDQQGNADAGIDSLVDGSHIIRLGCYQDKLQIAAADGRSQHVAVLPEGLALQQYRLRGSHDLFPDFRHG